MRKHRITSADGTDLFVADTGPTDAPAILLIHGWSQHHLSWKKQMAGPMADKYRLIAPDLRGHGASDKPDAPEAYNTSQPWAEDILAIIKELDLDKPLLVGWSMGGWLVCDYLSVVGADHIAGIALIGSSIRVGQTGDDPVRAKRRPEVQATGMYTDNQEANLSATIAFVKACFASPLSKQDLAFMVGFNMLVPPHIRKAARFRTEDYREMLATYKKPALIITGAAEKLSLPPMVAEIEAALPHASSIQMPGCGHAPFWEDPATFDAHLGNFAAQCFKEAA